MVVKEPGGKKLRHRILVPESDGKEIVEQSSELSAIVALQDMPQGLNLGDLHVEEERVLHEFRWKGFLESTSVSGIVRGSKKQR
jgi:hypothetical protein